MPFPSKRKTQCMSAASDSKKHRAEQKAAADAIVNAQVEQLQKSLTEKSEEVKAIRSREAELLARLEASRRREELLESELQRYQRAFNEEKAKVFLK